MVSVGYTVGRHSCRCHSCLGYVNLFFLFCLLQTKLTFSLLDGCIYVALDKSVVQYCKRIDSRDPINVSAFEYPTISSFFSVPLSLPFHLQILLELLFDSRSIPMPNSTHIRGITEGPSGAIWVRTIAPYNACLLICFLLLF